MDQESLDSIHQSQASSCSTSCH